MQSLHKLRKAIIKLLYQQEFDVEEASLHENYLLGNLKQDDCQWINIKINCIKQNKDHIDSLIAKHSENWKIERLGLVEKQILRLSTAELLFFPEVPMAVAIDEAVKLAKQFCGVKSSGFINGILEAIARESSD